MRSDTPSSLYDPDDRSPTELSDRLDASIGETSSGIGALLSELVRRSLRAGVSDIGSSLVDYAHEQVETAIGRQMPLVTENAEAAAEKATERLIGDSIRELRDESTAKQQSLQSEISAVETRVFDRSREHVHEVVGEVRQTIELTQSTTVQHNESMERRLEEMREKARQSWHKRSSQFTELHTTQRELLATVEQLRDEQQQQRTSNDELRLANSRLAESLATIASNLDQHAAQSEARIASQEQQHQVLEQRLAILEQRLAVLEQPRGLRALLGKFKRAEKGTPAAKDAAQETRPDDAIESD